MDWNGNSETTFKAMKKRRDAQLDKLIEVFNKAGFVVNKHVNGVSPALPPGYQPSLSVEQVVLFAPALRDALAHFDERLGDTVG